MPNASWNSARLVARLASTMPSPKQHAARQHDDLRPEAVAEAPQAKAAKPITRKLRVMAVEMPVRVQPVSTEIGCRKTASENIAPMLTQVISAPAATITQP